MFLGLTMPLEQIGKHLFPAFLICSDHTCSCPASINGASTRAVEEDWEGMYCGGGADRDSPLPPSMAGGGWVDSHTISTPSLPYLHTYFLPPSS